MTGRRTPEVWAPCRPGSARTALGSTERRAHSSGSRPCYERDFRRPSVRVASCYLDASVDRNPRRGSLFGAEVSDQSYRSESHLRVQRSPSSRLGCPTVVHPLADDTQRSSSRAMDSVTAHSMARKGSHNGFLPWRTVVFRDGATNSGDYRWIVTLPMKGDSLAFNL